MRQYTDAMPTDCNDGEFAAAASGQSLQLASGGRIATRCANNGGNGWPWTFTRGRSNNNHDAGQGSSTILPPSPPASIRVWTSRAATRGRRSTTTG